MSKYIILLLGLTSCVLLQLVITTGATEIPLILFNNNSNGINYDYLSEGRDVILTVNSTKAYEMRYDRIKGLDFDINDKYIVWSNDRYPYSLGIAIVLVGICER